MISVLLESRDMIGLGFDICGSMRDGIYVSQVHNRGPAIETGLIKIGKVHCTTSVTHTVVPAMYPPISGRLVRRDTFTMPRLFCVC